MLLCVIFGVVCAGFWLRSICLVGWNVVKSSAKKNSMLANYQRYEVEHKERRKAERLAARQAQQEEFLARQNRMGQ